MVATLKPWPLAIAVTLCVLFCLGTFIDAHLTVPVHPGPFASPRELEKYKTDLVKYMEWFISSSVGKRSLDDSLMSDLMFGDSSISNEDHKGR